MHFNEYGSRTQPRLIYTWVPALLVSSITPGTYFFLIPSFSAIWAWVPVGPEFCLWEGLKPGYYSRVVPTGGSRLARIPKCI